MHSSFCANSSILIKESPFLLVISFKHLHNVKLVVTELIVGDISQIQSCTEILIDMPIFSASIWINCILLFSISTFIGINSRLKSFYNLVLFQIFFIRAIIHITLIFIRDFHFLIKLVLIL